MVQAQAEKAAPRRHVVIGRDLTCEEGVKDSPTATGGRGQGLRNDQVVDVQAALFCIASARSRFSRAFSVSRPFSLRASETSRPPYLAFHL